MHTLCSLKHKIEESETLLHIIHALGPQAGEGTITLIIAKDRKSVV